MTTQAQSNVPKKETKQTNPNKFIGAVFQRHDDKNPLKQFVSFEQNKNGTVAMYTTNLHTLPLERMREGERPIYVKVLSDSKKNAKGIIQNSAWALSTLVMNMKSWFKQGKDTWIDAKDQGKVKPVVSPFNAGLVTGHMTSSLVPTYAINRVEYNDFFRMAIQLYKIINKEQAGSQVAAEKIKQLMTLQEVYHKKALGSGQLQLSHVIYVNRDGYMPILALNSKMTTSTNKLLDIKTYLSEEDTNLVISYPALTNSWDAYVVMDMGIQSSKSSNGQFLPYGVSDLPADSNGQSRKRFLREGIIHDGQGNEQRITVELVNATYGDGGRAQILEDSLATNNHIVAFGQLTAYQMYGDSQTLASRFNLVVDNWWTNNQPNQTTLGDNGFIAEPDMFASEHNLTEMKPVLDENGEQVLNEDGSPKMEEVPMEADAIDKLLEADMSAIFEVGERQRAPTRKPVEKPAEEAVDTNSYADDDLPF